MPSVFFCKSSKMFQSPEWSSSWVLSWVKGGGERETGICYCLQKPFATVRNALVGVGVMQFTPRTTESQFTTFTRGDVPIRAWSVWKRPAADPAKCSKSFPRLQSVDGRTETKS